MRRLLTNLFTVMLIGAAIGAIAAIVISGLDLRGALEGAFIGGAIGAFFGLRAQVIRRSAIKAGVASGAGQREA